MNENQIIENILHTLRINKDIFDSSVEPLLYKKPKRTIFNQGSIQGLIFYYPTHVEPDVADGFKLKDNKGYIAISETYRKNNARDYTKIAHVYKYITDEYIYECRSTKQVGGMKKSFNYYFHYDMDLNNNSNPDYHAPTHLQVLHPHPRFPIDQISVELFINKVKTTCFKPDLTPFTDPIYILRHSLS